MNPHRTARLKWILSMVVALVAPARSIGWAAGPALTAQVTEGLPIPHSVAGHAGGVVDGLPVIVGGSSWSEDRTTKTWRHECYVFREGKWVPGPSLPKGIADPAFATSPAGGLYIAGGTDGKTPVREAYHLASASPNAQWRSLPPLPQALDGAAGAIIGDTFYVVGGFTEGTASNAVWALNVNEPGAQWKACSALPADGRAFAALVATGEKILYLFGGFTSPPYQADLRVFNDAYRYDPAKDQWEKLQFDLPGYAWTATAVDDRRILLTGRAPEIGVVTDEILLLDLSTVAATPIGRLVIQSCCMPSIRVGPNTWWLPGGEPDTKRSRTARTSIIELKDASRDE